MSTTSDYPNLSVIIPAYNEERRLGANLVSVMDFLNTNYPSHELVIVNDGSTDNTAQVAAQKKVRLISYSPNRGKGFATKTGVLASRGDIVLFMDADLSTPLEEIPKILKSLHSADIVIGSRGKTKSQIHKRPPLFRQLASLIFDQIKYAMVGLRQFSDTQCGFKAFRGPVARHLFSQCLVDRFMFDVEILYLAEKAHLRILEMPVAWADVPGSTVRFWEGVKNMFHDLWRIRHLHP